jgi:uncharacterized protein YjbI with pentapeptide repeats
LEPEKPALSSKSEKASGPWRPTKRQVLWIIGMVVALLTTALLIINLHPEIWKGLLEERNLTLIAIGVSLAAIIVLLAIGGATRRWTGFQGKTVWDFLQLLIVPLALAVVGFLFTMQQDIRQQHIEDRRVEQAQKIEDERAQQAQKIENERAAAERELAQQRARDVALQAYLDQMSHLLLEKDLRNSKEDSVVRTLARARTAAVIQGLDGPRNRNVIRFLNEAHLIGQGESSIHLLADADLQGAGLHDADLSSVDLSGANLSGANLDGAYLSETNLSGADLSEANLSWAYLDETTNLKDTQLKYAELRGADLWRVNLSRSGAGFWLKEVDLRDAFLYGADLHGAALISADLRGAWLKRADLHGAIVEDTDLSGAEVTQEQLASCASLRSSTMPDGQTLKGYKKGTQNGPTFKEWLKDKQASKKDGKDE